jgi:hypothetical protein
VPIMMIGQLLLWIINSSNVSKTRISLILTERYSHRNNHHWLSTTQGQD